MHNSIYGLIIVAHPDDESFLFAGTTLQFEDQGKVIGIICATKGEKGADRLNRNLSTFEMAKIRTKELLGACHILNCECKNFYDYPDGGLDQVDFDELVNKLIKDIDRHQPEIILTFGDEGVSGHRDHIAIGKAATKAAMNAENKPKEVWKASIPASMAEDFVIHAEKRRVHHKHYVPTQLVGVPDEKLIKINVSKYKDQKLEAIEAHKSQYIASLIWPQFLEEECFEVIKL